MTTSRTTHCLLAVVLFAAGSAFSADSRQLAVNAAAVLAEASIVRVEAAVSESPPKIRLLFHDSGKFTIYRKALNATDGWGMPVATTGPKASEWTDTKVNVGQAYEYLIRDESDKPTFRNGTHILTRGYIAAGIRVDHTGERGKVIVVVDKTILKPLATEIERLKKDLVGDGWTVEMLPVERGGGEADTMMPPRIKEKIKAIYNADPKNTKHLFFLGHVPTARSGLFAVTPDGHRDGGAFGTDSYYADVDGVWIQEHGILEEWFEGGLLVRMAKWMGLLDE